jgi:hypothetical protein
VPRALERDEPQPRAARLPGTVLAFLPYALFLLLTALSWGRWMEPYVDAGRELETPWRVSRGEALYRDVRFYHGPLGPYLAAVVDRAAGPSIPARVALAGLVALASLEGLRRLAARLLSPGRAAMAACLVVAVCFFQPPGGCHLFPFSLDTALASAAIVWALVAASGRQSAAGDHAAGLCLLAALLARPEMGLAAVAALALERRSVRRLVVPAVLPLAAAAAIYTVLSAGTPVATLRREGWLAFLGPPRTFRNIYAAYSGLDRPALRLAELALAAVVLLLVAAVLAGAASLAARVRRGGSAIEGAAVVLLLAAALVRFRPPAALAEALGLFPPLVRVVPPLVLAGGAWRLLLRLFARRAPPRESAIPDAALYTAALFAARLLLAAGYTGPYSAFLLPLPLVLALAGLDRLARRGAPALGARLPRLAAAALALFGLYRVAELARVFRHEGWARVVTPAGSVWLTEPVASATRSALQDLLARLSPGALLTGFPEAGFYNYVLRLKNPLPQDQFFPGHLDERAEADVIARLSRRPPDAILYANVLAVGHRSVRFGIDYLADLDRFVRSRFESAGAYGPGAGPAPRIGDPQFFVEILVPRNATPGSR